MSYWGGHGLEKWGRFVEFAISLRSSQLDMTLGGRGRETRFVNDGEESNISMLPDSLWRRSLLGTFLAGSGVF